MRRISTLFFAVIFLMSNSIVYDASAQNVMPAVDLECELSANVNVYPGATMSGYVYCIASNPSAYSEKIEISIESGVLNSAAPGSLTVPAAAEVEFQVLVRAEEGMMKQSMTIDVNAVVTEANGISTDSLPEASDSATVVVNILQYSRMSIEVSKSQYNVETDSVFDVVATITNEGNWEDELCYSATDWSRDNLESNAFVITQNSFCKEVGMGEEDTVTFTISTPASRSETDFSWEKNDDENYEALVLLELEVRSTYSCNYETSGCNWQRGQVLMLVTDIDDSGVIATLSDGGVLMVAGIGGAVLIVAVAVVVLRKTKGKLSITRTEYEEFEDDVEDLDDEIEEDDFEDDLDDDFFDDL